MGGPSWKEVTLVAGLLWHLSQALRDGLVPTLRDVVRTPRLLVQPSQLSRVFMAHVWVVWSPESDASGREAKEDLVCSRASGVVLDIGAGHGSLARYLDRGRVTAYVALEPNTLMHPALRRAAAHAGFSEAERTFLIVPSGLEDPGLAAVLESSGISATGRVDTAIAVLSLCTVTDPQRTMTAFVDRVLAPGGQFLWYEHVRNPKPEIARWQDRLAPLWGLLLDHCRLGQDTASIIRAADEWAAFEVWGKKDEDAESLLLHSVGCAVRR